MPLTKAQWAQRQLYISAARLISSNAGVTHRELTQCLTQNNLANFTPYIHEWMNEDPATRWFEKLLDPTLPTDKNPSYVFSKAVRNDHNTPSALLLISYINDYFDQF